MKKLFATLLLTSFIVPAMIMAGPTNAKKPETLSQPYRARIRIVSPNGEEIWNRNKIQLIEWNISVPKEKERNFWPKASIDLYKRVELHAECKIGGKCFKQRTKSVFVKHIDNVNPFDETYEWKIPKDIPSGDGYVIKISAKVPQLIWGESNRPFTITETDDVSPEPVCGNNILEENEQCDDGNVDDEDDCSSTCEIEGPKPEPEPEESTLTEVIEALQKTIQKLLKIIELLKELALA